MFEVSCIVRGEVASFFCIFFTVYRFILYFLGFRCSFGLG